MKKSHHPHTDANFSDDKNIIKNVDELNFSDDKPTPSFGDLDPEFEMALHKSLNSIKNNSLIETTMPGDEPSDNDLAPEILIKEDGACSPHESGKNTPADYNLTIVDESEIGGGYGLDEAELARKKPLDGKPWDDEDSNNSNQ